MDRDKTLPAAEAKDAQTWSEHDVCTNSEPSEKLCAGLEQHKLNGRCDVSQLRDFAARILHPHGGPSVVRLSVKHSIGAAISHCRKQLTPKCKWRQSHVAARGEWVLQVPSSGLVYRAAPSAGGAHRPDGQGSILSVAHVQECLQHDRTPLLRLCLLEHVSVQPTADDETVADEREAAEATQTLIGPPITWSSESFEVVEFRQAMRQLRPMASAAHAAAQVWQSLPSYRANAPSTMHFPDKIKIRLFLSSDITKVVMASPSTSIPQLLLKANREYEKLFPEILRDQASAVLKVVGSNEFLDEGELREYTHVRKCLNKAKEIELALVERPLLSLTPKPSPRPTTSTSSNSRRSFETRSLYNVPHQCKLRLKVISVENMLILPDVLKLRAKTSENWVFFVRLGIWIGGTALCDALETEMCQVDGETPPRWNTWLQTTLPIASIPRAARACFSFFARSTLAKKEDDIPLGWVSTQLIQFDEQLISGVHMLKLWPNEEANPIGCVMENLSAGEEGQRLYVQFDEFEKPVFMPKVLASTLPTMASMGRLPTPGEIVELKRIIELDPLSSLSAAEKSLLWTYKHFIVSSPPALPKLLQSFAWNDRKQVHEMHDLLRAWAPLAPTQALELLDAKFADAEIRAYAVDRLDLLTDAELAELVLQLSQVLKYEPRHDSALARMLLRRALASPHQIGHQLFWLLKAEMHFAEVSERFGLLLEEYLRCCGPHRSQLLLQNQVEQQLIRVATLVKRVHKSERVALLRQELRLLKLPPKFQLPLDPRYECSGLVVDKCKCMDSKKVPLWLVFENADPLGAPITTIFKCGDDLRQDALTLQILRIMERSWACNGLDLRLSPYGCVATGDSVGFIEVVLDSDTTANITKRYGGGAGAAFSKTPMCLFLREHNPTERAYERAVETFCLSLAGYCVATYVIGIGDRHNDNVMLSKNGHLFHIDFGHFLGNFKSKFGFKRERAPFVFTPDFAHVLGGRGSDMFERFVDVCCQAYSTIRRHSHEFTNLFSLMLSTGIPELRKAEDIYWLRACLMPTLDEQQAAEHFTKLIYVALATRTTQVNNAVHIIAHS